MLFWGYGVDKNGQEGYLNDTFEILLDNTEINESAWKQDFTGDANSSGTSNCPSGRYGSGTRFFSDSNRENHLFGLYIYFGGFGMHRASGATGYLSDLWINSYIFTQRDVNERGEEELPGNWPGASRDAFVV